MFIKENGQYILDEMGYKLDVDIATVQKKASGYEEIVFVPDGRAMVGENIKSRFELENGEFTYLADEDSPIVKMAEHALREEILRMVAAAIPDDSPAELLKYRVLARKWAAGEHYALKELCDKGGQLFQVMQVDGVTAQEHQPPDAEGMLAVYRPISNDHKGTKADPFTFVYGMEVKKGKYYLHSEKKYKCTQSIDVCVWYPGTAGVHFFEEASA